MLAFQYFMKFLNKMDFAVSLLSQNIFLKPRKMFGIFYFTDKIVQRNGRKMFPV